MAEGRLLTYYLWGRGDVSGSAVIPPAESWLGEELQRGEQHRLERGEPALSEMATLTRLGPDTPSIMEKGSKELEDTLAVERKKVRPRPPLPSQPAAHRPRCALAAAQG